MSDSEDENYVSFGNPLEPLDEDNLPRKRAITAADQCVYDTEGRRRFHGAFTGGFSAGYFNGVGSRDGWTPKRFKSSRAERTAGVVQRPEDFMDEEDTGQFGIAPTAIRTTGGYQDLDKAGANALRRRQAQQGILFEEGPIPGAPVLGEILRPARDTVGVILLKKMGWRPGQGVGARVTRREKRNMRRRTNRMKKVYGCAGPPGQDSLFRTSTDESANEEEEEEQEDDDDDDDDSDENSTITFAPDDYEPFRREPKDNLFGIGYAGLDRHTVLSDSRERKAVLAESFFRQEKDRRIAKHGRAFGVGAFEEEDEDIYAQDDMSRYDFTLAPEDAGRKSTRSRERVTGNTAAGLDGFTRAASGLRRPDTDTADEKTRRQRKFFPPPVLPANFNPVHATSRFSPRPMMTRIEKRPIRSVEDRAAILDEKSRGPLTKDEKKSVKELEKERSKGASAWLEKLQDCQSFVTGGLLTRTGAEQKEETSANVEHVETAAAVPADGGVEESRRKAAKLKMFGKLTRERVEWRACSIVYKRFNVHEPKDDAKSESGVQRKSVKFSLLSKSIDFLSAGGEKKEIFSRKTEVAEDAKKTEMQLVEEASHSRNQEDRRIESVTLSSTEPSSSRSPLPTPFEVSYEKIFGKAISGDAVGGSKGEPSEKKDLFKAIFLDSEDEDHASDQKEKEKEGDSKEDEQEAMKSVLIGSILERKPSFSPPRGIFSNLDKLEKKKEWTREKNVSEKEHEDSSRVSLNVQDPGCLPENTYGPALPSTSTNNHHQRGQKTENSHKQVLYKSVVVPSRSENAIEERWVELKRAKKSKKEKKKKRKHKESKKSKKESSRRRKH